MKTNLTDLFAEAANTMLTPAKKKPEQPSDVGLSNVKALKTEKEFLKFINDALLLLLDYHPTDVPRFSKTLKAYLTHLGITNEKTFQLFDEFPQPPTTLKRKTSDGKEEDLNSSVLTIVILRGLAHLSKITKTATMEGLYLEDPNKIDLIEEWTNNVVKINNKLLLTKTTPTSSFRSNGTEKKFPDFELKKFNTFDGDVNKYLESVVHDFTEKKVISFLDDSIYAVQHPDTSKGYCFTLFKSFKNSQFEYLGSEYKKTIHNSAELWSKIKEICTTNVSEMSEIDAAWSKIFKLRCNDIESFDMFYSDYVTAENKLDELKSTAIKDNHFLRSMLFHKINIEELKSETSELLLGDKSTPVRNILKDIKKKANAWNANLGAHHTTSARKSTSENTRKKPKLDQDKKVKFAATLPKNNGSHIPPWAYKQFSSWFDIMSKEHDKRSEDEKTTLKNFKFWYPGMDERKNRKEKRSETYKARKAKKKKEEEEKEREPPTPEPPQVPPSHNYQGPPGYYDERNHWGQPPVPDSYARRAGYENQGNGNRYHPSGYGRGRGRGGYNNHHY